MIATLSQVKSYLGITTDQYDDFLKLQMNIVNEAMESYCERSFEKSNYVQTFYREDFPQDVPVKSFFLHHYPLSTVSEVLEKCKIEDDGIEIADFRPHLPSSKITKNCGLFFTNGNILEVHYSAGYDDIPYPLVDVFFNIIQERYNKKKSGVNLNFGSDVQRISIPGTISIDYDYSLQNNERKTAFGVILGSYVNVLDSYRSERALIGTVRTEYVS